jgi:hypothetical protein
MVDAIFPLLPACPSPVVAPKAEPNQGHDSINSHVATKGAGAGHLGFLGDSVVGAQTATTQLIASFDAPPAYVDDQYDGSDHETEDGSEESLPSKRPANKQGGGSHKTKRENNDIQRADQDISDCTKLLAALKLAKERAVLRKSATFTSSKITCPAILKNGHREKNVFALFNAMVATPLKQWKSDPRALKALAEEHAKLIAAHVWDEKPLEWSEVSRAAREKGLLVHLGRVFAIMSVKGSELSPEMQKVKARLVFSGDNVSTNVWQQLAEFADLGSSPASMAAYRTAVALGCAPGMAVQQADAEAAYIQSMLSGTDTYVIIPTELQTPQERLMKNPVHRLRKALYGHPDAGTCWEVHCTKALTAAGFSAVADWPSCFVHRASGCFLIVYVDDFLLSGAVEKLPAVWNAIKKEIKLGSEGPLSHFLGCTHKVVPKPTPTDKHRVEISFDMSGYLSQSIEAYREQANYTKPFLPVQTPFLTEEKDNSHEPSGLMAAVAQSILPKLLYAARLARPDLILPINLLSRYLTKWTAFHDRALLRLVAYVETSKLRLLRGCVGSGVSSLKLYCDADFAGCLDTARSTSGLWLVLAGDGWSFPLEWGSKRQTCVAHSTS